MKRIFYLILSFMILVSPKAFALEIPGYEGGIKNENKYKEVIFLTGKPIELEGEIKITTKDKGNIRTEQYTYKLENLKEDVKLSRTIKLNSTIEVKGGQTTSKKELDSYKESVTIGKTKYSVSTNDYQWNQGQVMEDTGLIQFHAGDWSARKTYEVDKGAREITVQTIGNLVGYVAPWSGTETQTLQYIIEEVDKLEPKNNWSGTALVEASYNKTKDYAYVENVPNQISFKGGYILTEKDTNILKYNYDLPALVEGASLAYRNIGTGSTEIDTNPLITRLNIPAIRDARGLESEKDLLLVASMEGLPLNMTNIGPKTQMSRGDFARALVATMTIDLPQEEVKKSKKKEEVKDSYIDVGKNHRNYKYIEAATKAGIMSGIDYNRFQPDKLITRTEAIATLVKALGIANQAPLGNYTTGYQDDASIPAWAKSSVYMAKAIDLIEPSDYFYPNQAVTKEEGAVLLVRFIHYMQKQLIYDFRENILNN